MNILWKWSKTYIYIKTLAVKEFKYIYYWVLDPNWIKKLDQPNMPMALWIYRALISGTHNYNREMQAGFKHRLAAKFKLSVVLGKLAPDLITAIHMAVDIFLVNSDVVYVTEHERDGQCG